MVPFEVRMPVRYVPVDAQCGHVARTVPLFGMRGLRLDEAKIREQDRLRLKDGLRHIQLALMICNEFWATQI